MDLELVPSRPVLDRTGLTGDYDLHMEFAPEAPAPNRARQLPAGQLVRA
jgi:uncharacterized protein (TIGR03435 family)